MSVEDSMSEYSSRQSSDTHFQCVYCACGPVEKLTFLCVHWKTISNQARKAWASDQTVSTRAANREGGMNPADR